MSAIAWYNLGVVYLDADQKDLAAEAFDKVVNLGPKDPELAFTAVYNLANLYFDTKQYEKALQNYNKAAELRGSYAPVQYQIGVTYLLLEKYAEAEGALQKCVSLTQDDTTEGGRALYQDAMYNLGISYIQVQNFDKAIATFTTLLARQETAEIHEALGRAYSRKGDSGKALEELQKAEAFRNK
jgi:tetratricopeptide (TPR) repeat protein